MRFEGVVDPWMSKDVLAKIGVDVDPLGRNHYLYLRYNVCAAMLEDDPVEGDVFADKFISGGGDLFYPNDALNYDEVGGLGSKSVQGWWEMYHNGASSYGWEKVITHYDFRKEKDSGEYAFHNVMGYLEYDGIKLATFGGDDESKGYTSENPYSTWFNNRYAFDGAYLADDEWKSWRDLACGETDESVH